MKGWFQRFMAGRYGFDQFGGFLCISSLILIVIGAWVSPVLYWLGLAAIVYSYFRILSRNTRKRYSENSWRRTRADRLRLPSIPT